MSLGERILLRFCREPGSEPYPGGTSRTTVDNALDFLSKTVPGFVEEIRGREVLDFGCGYGHQAVAMARRHAARVVGLDLPRPGLLAAWQAVGALEIPNLTLTTGLPDDAMFDVVVSCSSFEHFADPASILDVMRQRTKPGGRVIVSFAEPWLSPFGSHMDGFTRLPWVNVLFAERTVMRVRSRFRSDGATCYEEVEGGLNRMTIRRFERIVRESGMLVERMRLFPVKGLPIVHRVPVLREFLTSAVSCVLVRR